MSFYGVIVTFISHLFSNVMIIFLGFPPQFQSIIHSINLILAMTLKVLMIFSRYIIEWKMSQWIEVKEYILHMSRFGLD